LKVAPLTPAALMVVLAEVPAILRDVRHAAQRAIQRRIEDRALPLAATVDLHRSQPFVPELPRLLLYLIEASPGHLSLQILFGLLRADVGEPNPNLDLISACTRLLRDEADLVPGLVRALRQRIL